MTTTNLCEVVTGMVFKRRDRLPFVRRIREWVLPRTGWMRAVTYMGHRLKRLPDSPEKIAAGIGIGVFFSFTPFFGFHILLAMLFAKIFRSNVFSAVAGTFFGNPLTFPLIIATSFGLGKFMVGGRDPSHEFGSIKNAFAEAFKGMWHTIKSLFGYGHSEMDRLVAFWHDVFFPYLVGGIIPGVALGIVSYYFSIPFIRAYQTLRRKRLAEKRRKNSIKNRDNVG